MKAAIRTKDKLRREVRKEKLASPKSGQKKNTRSVMLKYFDGDIPVMWLHCFVEPSGNLGGSGMMDPKRLLVHRVYYYDEKDATMEA